MRRFNAVKHCNMKVNWVYCCSMLAEYYLEKLKKSLRERALDAVMVSPGEEMEFLLGMTPMYCERFQGFFLKADGTMLYIGNRLYEDEMREALPEQVAVRSWFDEDTMTEAVVPVLKEFGLADSVIAVSASTTACNLLDLAEAAGIKFVSGKALLEEIRCIKTSEEMQFLRESAAIADRMFDEAARYAKPGMTEGGIAEFLLKGMEVLGGKRPECIAARGPHAAFPHYMGTDGVIGRKDILLLDYGCTWHGLYSDMTRMLFFGTPSGREAKLYGLVRRSNEEAEALCREGAFIPDISNRAREVLDEEGYAHTLINRLGHGIGYTIHEAPDIRASNPIHLVKGMAFSIEPGIYLPGEIGIRVEDIVLINEAGEGEVLNKAPKEPVIIG